MKKFNVILKVVTFIVVVLLVMSCAINPVTGKRQIMFMSEDQEVQLGASYDPQVIATFGLYNNNALNNFVQTQGNQMGKISHRPNRHSGSWFLLEV